MIYRIAQSDVEDVMARAAEAAVPLVVLRETRTYAYVDALGEVPGMERLGRWETLPTHVARLLRRRRVRGADGLVRERPSDEAVAEDEEDLGEEVRAHVWFGVDDAP